MIPGYRHRSTLRRKKLAKVKMTHGMTMQEKLANPWWRLNNLYKIRDKGGNVVTFSWNWAQQELYEQMHYLNIILKARQLGMTTAIQIFMLDRALFNDNQNCGIVAHNKEDAEAFFSDKIKFAYDNLPIDLRKERPATSDTARSLRFSNGSQIRVGTSMRSGTYQYIHISEFGKMCAKYPDKAQEVITGTLNTIAPGQMAFIESTAEGPFGEFYDMCRASQDFRQAVENGQQRYTALDWKFFFFPWYHHPDYKMPRDSHYETYQIPDKLLLYFAELKREHDIALSLSQKVWYAKKYDEQRDKMKQEYPSTPEEAFERSTELAIYGEQLRRARRDKRIGHYPASRAKPINTFWDLGRNDVTAIWFHQHIDAMHRFIYYYENRLKDLVHYVETLMELQREHGWYYGDHYLPHDVETTDISSMGQLSRREILEDAGLSPIITVPKTPSVNDEIEKVRRAFDEYCFDEEGCEVGLRALAGYEWTYDELMKTTRYTPAKNWAKNGADAIRQHAQGYRGEGGTFRAQVEKLAGGQRMYQRRRGNLHTLLNPSTDHIR
jgi:hypothetical protein